MNIYVQTQSLTCTQYLGETVQGDADSLNIQARNKDQNKVEREGP